MINYWEYVLGEYLVRNIMINYVITTFGNIFFVSVNIVINNMLGFKKKLIL